MNALTTGQTTLQQGAVSSFGLPCRSFAVSLGKIIPRAEPLKTSFSSFWSYWALSTSQESPIRWQSPWDCPVYFRSGQYRFSSYVEKLKIISYNLHFNFHTYSIFLKLTWKEKNIQPISKLLVENYSCPDTSPKVLVALQHFWPFCRIWATSTKGGRE